MYEEDLRADLLRRVAAYASDVSAVLYAVVVPLCMACCLEWASLILATLATALATLCAFGESAAVTAIWLIYSAALASHAVLPR